MQYNKLIDHTILKADTTQQQIDVVCEEARSFDFASVCVNPYWVPYVSKKLKGSDVLTCTVIGFPLGANSSATKAFETKQAVADGANEIDMVINIGAAKDANWAYVEKDIKAVVDAAAGKTVKVIKALYPDMQILVGGAPVNSSFCKEIGADYYSPEPHGALDFLNQLN